MAKLQLELLELFELGARGHVHFQCPWAHGILRKKTCSFSEGSTWRAIPDNKYLRSPPFICHGKAIWKGKKGRFGRRVFLFDFSSFMIHIHLAILLVTFVWDGEKNVPPLFRLLES